MQLLKWLASLFSFFGHNPSSETQMNHEPYRCDSEEDVLHVVTCITNPQQWESRTRLCKEFMQRMDLTDKVKLWVIEGARPEHDFLVTDADNPRHVQVRTKHTIWHKENLINVLVNNYLPESAKYIAWVDADVIFTRPDWVDATLAKLKDHAVVQLFSQCADLDSHWQIASKELSGETMTGMVYEWYRNGGKAPVVAYGRPSGHCGYAWAARREFFKVMGGLIDFSIVGSADFQMACAFMGSIKDSVSYPASQSYIDHLVKWGERWPDLQSDVGYIDGLVLHNWHGFKFKRGYNWRVNIMTKNDYAPERDLIKNDEGVIEWNVQSPVYENLKGELERYMAYRNEDVQSDNRNIE
jgi:hypothetical protein